MFFKSQRYRLTLREGGQSLWQNVQLKMENHAQLATVRSDSLDELLLIIDARHLPYAESVILFENGTEFLEVLVATGTASVVLSSKMDRAVRIGESLVLANEVDDIEAEAVAAPVQPEAHDVVDGVAHLGVLPVEVGLLRAEQVQVVLIGGLVVCPGAALEVAGPVVGGLAVPLGVVSGGSPDVPVSEGVVLGFPRLLEPVVLVAGVVHDEVEHQLHASLMQLVLEHIDV